MRKFFLLSLAFVAILTACTKESFAPQGDGLQEQQSQERAFEEKVRAFAASNLVSMQHGRGMPLTNLPNVESLEPIVSESNLRSGSGRDTVAYIVNFEQNGSMVIAGSRMLPLTTVAICDSRMAISDTIQDKGLATFMKLLELYYYQEVGQRIIDFGLASAQEVANFTRNDMQQFQTELSVYEDVPSPPSHNINLNDYVTFIHAINQAVILEKEIFLNVKWGQREPFNLYAEVMNNGERAPAGCVAIAVGQITSYHKYPKVLEGKTLNWEILSQATAEDFDTEEEQDEIASYIRKIGDYLGNVWTITGTHANLYSVPNALSRLGYTRGIISDYSRGLVEESLSAKLPLFIGGQSTGGGHAWVIDGYLKTSYDVLVYNNETGELVWTWTVYPSYYHCNWGADGRCNGFYRKDVFDLQHGMMYHDDGGQYYYNPQNPDYNFSFDVKIITGIKPKFMQIHES